MVSLIKSLKNSCFSAIFDPFDPFENYPDKKNVYIESNLIAASSPCVNARIAKMTIGPGITV